MTLTVPQQNSNKIALARISTRAVVMEKVCLEIIVQLPIAINVQVIYARITTKVEIEFLQEKGDVEVPIKTLEGGCL
jgi:hypothetical protein